jgi:hypothetical protein
MPRLLRILALAALLLAGAAASARAADAKPRATEYDLKAAFLFNFAQFVEWPPAAFASSNAPIVIAILGPDPFQGALDKICAGEEIRGRPLQVIRYAKAADVRPAHLLFIPRAMASQFPDAIARVADSPTLTVSDIDKFAERGGMIQLFTDQNQVRLRIDAEAARKANLSISSKLLRLAQLTRGGPQ